MNVYHNITRYKNISKMLSWWEWQVKSAKTTHTSVWITKDTTKLMVPKVNVHTNQILAHTFSHGTLDSD